MTAAMVRNAAKVHLDALAGSRTAMMGEAYVATYIDWFRLPAPGRIALAAIDSDGTVLGYVIGAPLGYPKALSRHLACIAAGAVIVRPWLFFRQQFRHGALDRLGLLLHRRPQAHGAEPQLPAPTMSLVAIGVSRAARGKKLVCV
jgi:hypothetical protein